MTGMGRLLTFAGLFLVGAHAHAHAQGLPPAAGDNDYPTASRAEYVFACMATNGHTQEALHRCSCAIDVIADAVPFGDYEKAETILRMRNAGGAGYLGQEFRVEATNSIIRELSEAQAEADVSCF
jgi:hypothetical protein